MPRAISSVTIMFGMVAIPCKLFTACSSEQVSFNLLHAKCKGRVKQQYVCPTDSEVVVREDMVKGFEHTKGQYVVFTDEELKSLEADKTNSLELVSFVPLNTVDLLGVEKSYFLGPDKGADRAYTLMADVLRKQDKVAVGRWTTRGKEQLVIIRPYGKGFVLHQMFYSNEIRSFAEIEEGIAKFTITDRERDLAEKLIEQLSADAFDPSEFKDEYLHRVNAAVQQKLAGQEIVIATDQPKAHIVDLFAALQASVDQAKKKPSKAKSDPVAAAKPVAAKTTKKKKAS